MNDLNLLLRDLTTDPPADSFDPGALLRTGRARVRRRRAGVAAGVAAAAALVVAVPLALGAGSPQAGPARGTNLRLSEAVPAVRGADYEVLRTFAASSTDRRLEGDIVRGVLPDGTTVVQRYDGPVSNPGSVLLVRANGTVHSLSTAPASVENFLGATATAVVFSGGQPGDFWLLDRSAGTWRRVHTPGADPDQNTPASPAYSSDSRIVLGSSPTTGVAREPVLEVDLAHPGRTRVLGRGGVATGSGDVVAWVDAFDRAPRSITVLDRSTGRQHAFDPQTPCVPKDIAVTPDRVVLLVNCRDRGGDGSWTDVTDHVLVYDHSGVKLATLAAPDLGPVRVSDRYVTLASWSREQAGTYTYSLASGRFLKVAEGASHLFGDETGAGEVLVWQRPTGKGTAEYVVARMGPRG